MAEETKTPSLNRIIAEINKKAGDTVIGRLGDMENVAMNRLVCGIPQLDEAIGGGFPSGRIVELYGTESAGKSMICQKVIANAQKNGGECIYVDLEGSFDVEFAQKLGVNTDKLIVMQPMSGEETFDLLYKLLEAKPAVIIIDSVGGMVTNTELEADSEKVVMAPKARLLSRALPKLTALNHNTLLLFINQVRQNITPMGAFGFVTPGGMAMKFAASVRIEVKADKDKLYEDGKKSGVAIGQVVKYRITKNKTFTPFKEGSFKFFYEDGRTE